MFSPISPQRLAKRWEVLLAAPTKQLAQTVSQFSRKYFLNIGQSLPRNYSDCPFDQTHQSGLFHTARIW